MPEALTRPTRILVVDDDRPFAAVIGEWLTGSGYDVTVAGDGQEAITLALQCRPDVVVADIRMPRMDGLQLLSAVKGYDRSIEVIFLSGQATLDDAVEALREGRGFDLLQKPLVNLQRLNVTIEKALRRNHGPGDVPEPPTPYAAPVARTLRYIATHLGEPLRVKDLAAAIGYSSAHLTELVRRETGSTIQQWVIRQRLALGERLLRDTDMAVDAIARSLGYDDPAYFARQFRQRHGLAPLAWRRAQRER